MIGRRFTSVLAAACVALASPHARADDSSDTWTPIAGTRLSPALVLGARAGQTTTRASEPVEGLSASVYMAGYAPLLRLSALMRAGRSYGADGKLAVDVALGPSYAFIERRAFVFVRFGARGQLEGNDLFTVNELEPLQAQGGVEFIVPGSLPVLVEVAGRGSFATGAHVSVGDFSRTWKPVPAWGGHFALGIGPFRAEGVFTRILPSGPSRASLDVFGVVACVHAGLLALCGDHSQTFTGLFGPGSSYYRENIALTGFTLGTSLR